MNLRPRPPTRTERMFLKIGIDLKKPQGDVNAKENNTERVSTSKNTSRPSENSKTLGIPLRNRPGIKGRTTNRHLKDDDGASSTVSSFKDDELQCLNDDWKATYLPKASSIAERDKCRTWLQNVKLSEEPVSVEVFQNAPLVTYTPSSSVPSSQLIRQMSSVTKEQTIEEPSPQVKVKRVLSFDEDSVNKAGTERRTNVLHQYSIATSPPEIPPCYRVTQKNENSQRNDTVINKPFKFPAKLLCDYKETRLRALNSMENREQHITGVRHTNNEDDSENACTVSKNGEGKENNNFKDQPSEDLGGKSQIAACSNLTNVYVSLPYSFKICPAPVCKDPTDVIVPLVDDLNTFSERTETSLLNLERPPADDSHTYETSPAHDFSLHGRSIVSYDFEPEIKRQKSLDKKQSNKDPRKKTDQIKTFDSLNTTQQTGDLGDHGKSTTVQVQSVGGSSLMCGGKEKTNGKVSSSSDIGVSSICSQSAPTFPAKSKNTETSQNVKKSKLTKTAAASPVCQGESLGQPLPDNTEAEHPVKKTATDQPSSSKGDHQSQSRKDANTICTSNDSEIVAQPSTVPGKTSPDRTKPSLPIIPALGMSYSELRRRNIQENVSSFKESGISLNTNLNYFDGPLIDDGCDDSKSMTDESHSHNTSSSDADFLLLNSSISSSDSEPEIKKKRSSNKKQNKKDQKQNKNSKASERSIISLKLFGTRRSLKFPSESPNIEGQELQSLRHPITSKHPRRTTKECVRNSKLTMAATPNPVTCEESLAQQPPKNTEESQLPVEEPETEDAYEQQAGNIMENPADEPLSDGDIPCTNQNDDDQSLHSKKAKAERKKLRNLGQAYINSQGKLIPPRSRKPVHDCKRLECKNIITDAIGDKIHAEFWAQGDHHEQMLYVASRVTYQHPQRRRVRDPNSGKNRTVSYKYHFTIQGSYVQVCKDTFLGVLNLSESFVRNTMDKARRSVTGTALSDSRGNHEPKHKLKPRTEAAVKAHIDSFPTYVSHYGRSQSQTLYFPSHLNYAIMHSLYCETDQPRVSYWTYKDYVKKTGRKFKKPHSDTCNTCDKLHMKINVTEGEQQVKFKRELDIHQRRAEKAYQVKREMKAEADEDESMRVLVFDLEQCLPTPKLKCKDIFYSRQLYVFNLTVYDSKTKLTHCYMWHEAEGEKGANQVASCLLRHLTDQVPAGVSRVVLFSDTCTGQNRNSVLAAMYTTALQIHPSLKIIEHIFLIPGHTHLEVDNKHSVIERYAKKVDRVSVPEEWYALVEEAGKSNVDLLQFPEGKFIVVQMKGEFLNFKALLKDPLLIKRKKTLDGKEFSWLEAHWFKYEKCRLGIVGVKSALNPAAYFHDLSFLRRGVRSSSIPALIHHLHNCYSEPLKISVKKLKDLLELLDFLHPKYHAFYKSLQADDSLTEDLDPDVPRVFRHNRYLVEDLEAMEDDPERINNDEAEKSDGDDIHEDTEDDGDDVGNEEQHEEGHGAGEKSDVA